MTLDKSRFIVRWFFWSLDVLDESTDGCRRSNVEWRGTNLCTFFQTTFVWVPLLLLAHALMYGMILLAVIVGPVLWFGAGAYAMTLVGIAAVVAVVVGIAAMRERLIERRTTHRYEEDERGPSSAGVVWAWLVAKKQRVCPMISFTSSEARS